MTLPLFNGCDFHLVAHFDFLAADATRRLVCIANDYLIDCFWVFFHIEYCISLLDSLVFDKSSDCFSSLSSLYKCNRFIRFSSHTRFHSSFIFLCLNIFTLFYVHSQSNLLFLCIHSNSNS